MPLIKANGIELFYDEFGDKTAPPLLLIMGLGTQMIAWSEAFCTDLAARGFRVIRFDNRDIGLSQKMENAPRYSVPYAMFKAWLGLPVRAAYTLDDMAADAVGLLDALGITRAHIVGASMGGMIAQIVAARYPDRCRSLVSIMSTSGDRRLPGPSREAMARLRAPRPPLSDREASIRFGMDTLKTIGSSGYPTPDDDLREVVARSLDRSVYPPGFMRQFLAILAGGSRASLLKTIRMPTLVLHGEADPLVNIAGGRDTARLVPGAVLKTYPGWGHDLPAELVPQLVDDIATHCLAANAKAA
ncbi:MAG: alpha/beta hydrolase [Mesorhizobium sp.]